MNICSVGPCMNLLLYTGWLLYLGIASYYISYCRTFSINRFE